MMNRSRDPGSRMATTPSGMTASLSPQSALVQDTLHIASVKLRILSETLEPLQEFEGQYLQLTCTGEEPSCCRLSFNTGRYYCITWEVYVLYWRGTVLLSSKL